QAWLDAGIGGTVDRNSVMASVLNRGGNKLDQYLATNADLKLRPSGGHTDATLTLTLKNNAPLNEIQYIIGPHFGTGLNPGDYLGIVAFTLPEKATAASVDGVNSIAVAGPDGPTRVIGGEILVPAGQSHTVVVHYQLPGTGGQLQIEPSARVPSMQWRFGDTTWQDAERKTVRW